ncbi:sugar phosphorylase [Bacillus sp. J14TS2]|uniref:sugar phosphorylase n=1 Tax=Bacillus sp. J14TS2 TaxID=2807188 RepID=UPI001BB32F03|nr:sugar phosphorylase [Bacillus sp. J14TS2]
MERHTKEQILNRLAFLYDGDISDIFSKIESIVEKYNRQQALNEQWISEKDVMLITYGDSILKQEEAPLKTLKDFLLSHVDCVNAVHILPFYPYTSDDGFSVVDYREIDPDLGSWKDINQLSNQYDLMFDAVINHISKSSDWFQGFLQGQDQYKKYFIEADPSLDYSQVTRPRALPLLTAFDTKEGPKYVWTTFSEDQIDLNYKNPDLLLEILDILGMYVANGAKYIRLDAIGFMWKELGTSCIHLEETHVLIKLMRKVLEAINPNAIIITETNVPHKENISYFGNGQDEAQMVYQFPLPPLTLFSFLTKNAEKLSDWLNTLESTTSTTTYFNFLASHDGIGLRPTEGILTEDEKQLLVDKALEHGGLVSYKDNGDGTKSPYELNINYLNALAHPDENNEVKVRRTMAAHSILLSVVGVPAVYIHSLLGSENDLEGVEKSGINRRINREKLNKDELESALKENTLRAQIFEALSKRIKLRRSLKAFHPNAKQKIIYLDKRIFSIIRHNEETGDQILAMVNVSDDHIPMEIEYKGTNLIDNQPFDGNFEITPNQTLWIQL